LKNTATKSKVPAPTATPRSGGSLAMQPPNANQPIHRPADCATLAVSAVGSAATSMELWTFVPTTAVDLIDALHSQTERLKTGDLTKVEEMLYCQAVTLQSVFTRCLQHAIRRDSLTHQTTVLTLAFKAQAQCRATLETLANIKNPRAVAFVRQANIAQNQQVNNGAGAPSSINPTVRPLTPAREKAETQQNELLTDTRSTHGNPMDTGTAGATGRSDSTMETVGKGKRPRIARRKASLLS